MPPQSSFLPLISLHTNMGTPLSLSVQRGTALISNSSGGGSEGSLYDDLGEDPDRGSRGPAIRVTTPRPQTASHSLTSNPHFAQEKTQLCCFVLIHWPTETEAHRECQRTHNLKSAATDVRSKAQTGSAVLTQLMFLFFEPSLDVDAGFSN